MRGEETLMKMCLSFAELENVYTMVVCVCMYVCVCVCVCVREDRVCKCRSTHCLDILARVRCAYMGKYSFGSPTVHSYF